jgi:methyl-accepting chemotaxis protein
VLTLVLRRSITRPLAQVAGSARALSGGDLSADVDYVGRDEIGDVADAFRAVHVTSERLAAEIRAMNAAITQDRLDHRADVAALDGTWSQLLGGMNETMAAFGSCRSGAGRPSSSSSACSPCPSTCCASRVSTATSSG